MARSIIAALAAAVTACAAPHQPLAPTCPVEPARLTATQALRDLTIVERALTALHPGLYRYLTPAALTAELARARAEVTDGADLAQMYLIVSRIGAAVRCGHTWTNPLNQGAIVQRTVLGRADKLPLRVRVIDDRLLVIASATPAVAAGAELLAIDGRTPAALIAELWPYLRADGSNDAARRAQLDLEDIGAIDRLLPLLHPPRGGRVTLRVRDAAGTRDVVVVTTTTADRARRLAAAGWRAPDPAWTFMLDGDTGVLTLPTFAFWDGAFDWAGFLDRSFAQLEAAGARYLIIDQRRNEGGDGAIVDALLAYLIDAPFAFAPARPEVAYERAPYALARFLDTWDTRFFDHTGQVVRAHPDDRTLRYTAAGAAPTRIVPAAHHRFRGATFILVGPGNTSAGFQLAVGARQSHAATSIGQPTGGNQRGINGGELAWLTLPESGVALDIPLVAWVHDGPDAGLTPDVVVATTFADVAAGRDPDLAAARAAIAALR